MFNNVFIFTGLQIQSLPRPVKWKTYTNYSVMNIYWLRKETLQTFCADCSNRNVALEYLLYSNKWIIATMLFASSIIVVYDWRFMRWRHLFK